MTEITHWGATADDWAHFDLVLGLGEDLLPVVSNPNAKISAKSTIKSLGKTPSLYNKSGEVVGIANWTSKRTTAQEINNWEKTADYGICIQTRRVRALDIDVEDRELAAKIFGVIEGEAGILPMRFRKNSGKFLLAFIVEGDLDKRVLPVEGGNIEFLAGGQQFIAAGCHSSGVRYEWIRGLPVELPVLALAEFERLWQRLVDTVGTGEARVTSSSSDNAARKNLSIEDRVLPLLNVLGWSKDKRKAFIECPFKSEHTSDSGISETVYFPAGTRGYQQGHFECLHAHCVDRSDGEFIEALGIDLCGFEPVVLSQEELAEEVNIRKKRAVELPLDYDLRMNEDGDKTLACVENLHAVLTRPHLCKQHIRYDTFRDEIVWKPLEGDYGWLQFKDTDYTRLRAELALTGFLPISREMIRDCVHRAAGVNKVDTAQEWLGTLIWDGKERVSSFMEKYMGAEKSDYSESVSRYMWAGLAGRVLSPGCKADAAVIFVGDQYIGKSYAVASMVPDQRFFTEIRFDDNEDNLSRKMRGKLIAEFAELRGLYTKDDESIKAFISRQYEEWVPKYLEFATIYPRRLLFMGTSNNYEFFADETGNRRWFPVRVKKADINAIKNDRDQLWAEGAKMFSQNTVHLYYDRANNLASVERDSFMISDPWEEDILNWMEEKDINGNKNSTCDFLQIGKIMQEVFMIDKKNKKKYDERRISRILHKFGFRPIQKKVDGTNIRVWSRCKP